jgi:hypothetical protein
MRRPPHDVNRAASEIERAILSHFLYEADVEFSEKNVVRISNK